MATTLTAGDVAIIRTDHSGTDDFTFVLLADVDATTEISFTNIGVNGGQYGNGAGALITWTSGTALAAARSSPSPKPPRTPSRPRVADRPPLSAPRMPAASRSARSVIS